MSVTDHSPARMPFFAFGLEGKAQSVRHGSISNQIMGCTDKRMVCGTPFLVVGLWHRARSRSRCDHFIKRTSFRRAPVKRWHRKKGVSECISSASALSNQGISCNWTKRSTNVREFLDASCEIFPTARPDQWTRLQTNRVLAVLKRIFHRCQDWNLFEGDNPVYKVKLVKEPRRRLHYLEPEEEHRLLGTVIKGTA